MIYSKEFDMIKIILFYLKKRNFDIVYFEIINFVCYI